MANMCTNVIEVKGISVLIDEFMKTFNFNTDKKNDYELKDPLLEDAYSWDNPTRESDTQCNIYIARKWKEVPSAAMKSLSRKYPELKFTLIYEETGSDYAGKSIFMNGMLVDSITFDNEITPEYIYFLWKEIGFDIDILNAMFSQDDKAWSGFIELLSKNQYQFEVGDYVFWSIDGIFGGYYYVTDLDSPLIEEDTIIYISNIYTEREVLARELTLCAKGESYWENDFVQFARLISETRKHLSDEVLDEISNEMDLEKDDILELITRADKAYSVAKENL